MAFADEVALVTRKTDELKSVLTKFMEEVQKIGLEMYENKTNYMALAEKDNVDDYSFISVK